ncbi:hypothetical protein M413DRAFT_146379 [Hebeloma cylindrosporum]|uniref:Uncharacterized protein n=1 Tax=Hebeloma cylindrosporum TaxID=76867 RepID=A0A0C2YJV6_HEBCY|nr:hypothetical protein M413DRAFT_146379 [Hebeloma cylindrosporum h7]
MDLKPEFAALLQNNDVPSESTILELTESLKAPSSELQEVEAEIQRLGRLMEMMEMKRQSIQKIINDHKIILSPVRRLPPDVLHEIFFHCLPTYHNPVMTSSESPLLLTRICSSWRAIALSSPRIWSQVYIPLPGDPNYSSGYGVITDQATLNRRSQRFASVLRLRCDAVRRWLSRSGTCPLSLTVTYPSTYSDVQNLEIDELIREMFDMLLSFADRWTDVDLSMPEDIYNKLQSNINPITFSSLTSLKISLNQAPHWNNTATQQFPIRLLDAPRLRRLHISATQTSYTPMLRQSFWNHFTHITFASPTTDEDVLVLLRGCPNLVFGKFFVIPSSQWDQTVDQFAVVLPRLRSLYMQDSGAHESMAILFKALNAPSLTSLSYHWFSHRSPGDGLDSAIQLPVPVIPLLENSTLISYLLLDGVLSRQDTQKCLQHGARVTHVVFGEETPASWHPQNPSFILDTDVVRPDTFNLKMLSIGSGAVTLLPKLESLEAYHLSSLTDEDLLDVITSRIKASQQGEVAALKSIKIHFQRQRQRDITEDVFRLTKEAGIEVKLDLTYPPEDSRFVDRFSPSFGFTSNDEPWFCLAGYS